MMNQHTSFSHKDSSSPLTVNKNGIHRKGEQYKGKSPRNSSRRQNYPLHLFFKSNQCRNFIFYILASGLLISLGISIVMLASFEEHENNTINIISFPETKQQRRIATSVILPLSSSYTFTKPNPRKPRKLGANRGDLNLAPVANFDNGRVIRDDHREEEGHVYGSRDFDHHNDDWRDPYYAFDDDYERNNAFDDEHSHHCRRTSWHRYYFPNCNIVHETDWLSWKVISNGHYRDVWTPSKFNEHIIYKTMRNKHKFKYENYEIMRAEALVMERLTSSPRIVDIYALCAVSVISEFLDEDLYDYVIPSSGHLLKHSLNDKYDVDPQNEYTTTEKLEMALQMAEALADLHGFKEGVIVHDDIKLSQFLRNSKTGVLKLNDFNRAEVMLWDENNEKYCRYRNGRVYGRHRSPEEVQVETLNEQIDVWSLGNIFYELLTGLWNFYGVTDDEVVQNKITDGETAYIDPRYRHHSYPESALVHAIEECWKYYPDERVDIFQLVELLRYSVEKNKQLLKPNNKK